MNTATVITPAELARAIDGFPPPTLIDARAPDAFERDHRVIPGAIRRDSRAATTCADIDTWRPAVVYCERGGEASRNATAALRASGFDARSLEGGIEAWRASNGDLAAHKAPTRWVTRARPKIDRIACPWLVRRFIDPAAQFFYVPASDVRAFGDANAATPFDIAGVPYGHDAERCSFDAFVRLHDLHDEALAALAIIVRAADTGALELSPQAPGLLAASRGLSALFADDHAMLRAGMLMYDALYLWCRTQVAGAAKAARA
jgi:rhodanese-related sulfurtransferase